MRSKRASDYDSGYLWGKAGKAKAKKKATPKGYLWSDKNRKKADEQERNK